MFSNRHTEEVYDQGENIVTFVPMFHIFGLLCVGSMAHCFGAKTVFMPRFDFEEYLRLIQAYKVCVFSIMTDLKNATLLILLLCKCFHELTKVFETYNLRSVHDSYIRLCLSV